MLTRCRCLIAVWKPGVLALSCVVLALVWKTSNADSPKEEPDVVCEALLREYVLNTGKIESRSVNAAVQLLGTRARGKNYWKVLLQLYKESDLKGRTAFQSSRLLTVLTIMLEYDGQARWLLAHPERLRESAWVPDIKLSNDVLDAIIERAASADRNQLDAHVIAVVAAHDPRATKFLKSILESNEIADQGTRFHAAVGLAEFNDPEGFRWLVETNPYGEVWSSPHAESPTGSCLESRIHALNDLIGLKMKTIEEWQAWWRSQREPVVAKNRVNLRYP